MANHTITLRLGGKGGNGKRNKISVKSSAENRISRGLNKTSSLVGGGNKTVQGSSGGMMNLAKSSTKSVGMVYMALKIVDQGIQLGTNIWEAHSGETMRANNIKAVSKTVSNFGLNLLSGAINNEIMVKPALRRANIAGDYNRQIYDMNVFGEKGKVR